MHRAQVYTVLADELTKWRNRAPSELVSLVGEPAARTRIDLDSELLEIEVSVIWNDASHKAVRVVATANGSSSWRLERLEEAIVVPV